MNMQRPDERTLDRLIALGQCGDSDSRTAEILSSLKVITFVSSIHQFHDFEWLRDISWTDACAIVRAIVKLEAARLTKSGGSVSAVKNAFRIMEDHNRVGAMELAAWIVDHSDNDYIPFPVRKIRFVFADIRQTAGSWSECREELDRWQFAEWARQQRVASEIANQKPDGKRRREIHKTVAKRLNAEQAEIQHARASARMNLLTELCRLSIKERLEHFAWDDSRSLSCYPVDLAVCSVEDLQQLDPVTRDRVVAKLRDRKKGPWQKLAAQLELL
jgi:hypothetical protein